MKRLLKGLVLGTTFEPYVRKVHSLLARGRSSQPGNSVPDKNSLYDAQAFAIMRSVLHKDSNCVDIGCHEGSFLKEMLKVAPLGTHFAFEPLPDMFAQLQSEFEDIRSVKLFDCALSDTQGSTTFQFVVSNPGYSGLRPRKYDRPREEIREITVKMNLLDNVIPRDLPVHFLKVDVEGAELQVFRGGVETIHRARPVIVFEHGLGAADCYGTAPESVYDLLVHDCDLALFVMGDWLAKGREASLSREAFSDQFRAGKNYYFMAAPLELGPAVMKSPLVRAPDSGGR